MSRIVDSLDFPPLGSVCTKADKSDKGKASVNYACALAKNNASDNSKLGNSTISTEMRNNDKETGESSLPDLRKIFTPVADQKLKFITPTMLNGKKVAAPTQEMYTRGSDFWKNAIVAQFIGKIPNFSYFHRMVNILWGSDGEVDVRPAGSNLFIIQFPNIETRDRVLESGPWHIQNHPLVVRRWELGMGALDFNMSRLPVWLHLRNVPLELFIQDGLSCIASVIGNPLYMDRITASQKRLAYAKVCIEIEVTTEIPLYVEIVRQDGSLWQVDVEVPWSPQKCLNCCIFGHSSKNCPKQLPEAKVWIPVKSKIPSKEIKTDFVIDKENEVSAGAIAQKFKTDAANKVDVGPSVKNDSGRQGGIAGSVSRFAILNEPVGIEDKEDSSKVVNKLNLTSVSALMESIKDQIADKKVLAMEKKENRVDQTLSAEEKGKGLLVEESVIEDDRTISSCSLTGDKRTGSIVEESSPEDQCVLSTKKPLLPITNLLRKPRLASKGVPEAVAAVKGQNKKCRRQVKKASIKKS